MNRKHTDQGVCNIKLMYSHTDLQYSRRNRNACPRHRQWDLTLIDLDATGSQDLFICSECQRQYRRGHEVIPTREFLRRSEEIAFRGNAQVTYLENFVMQLKRIFEGHLKEINELEFQFGECLKELRRSAEENYNKVSEKSISEMNQLKREWRAIDFEGEGYPVQELERMIHQELRQWKFINDIESMVETAISKCKIKFDETINNLQQFSYDCRQRTQQIMQLESQCQKFSIDLTEVKSRIGSIEGRNVIFRYLADMQWSSTLKHKDVMVRQGKAERKHVEMMFCRRPVIVSVLAEQILSHELNCIYVWKVELCKIKNYVGFGMCIQEKCQNQGFMSHSLETRDIKHGHYLVYADTGYVSSHCDTHVNNLKRSPIFPKKGIIEITYNAPAGLLSFRHEEIFYQMKIAKPDDPLSRFRPEIRIYDEGDIVRLVN